MKIDALKIAKEVFATEAKAIEDLALNLDENFSKAIELMLHTKG
ncbi:KpsF/GutQ family sugar-phosphate isomerase, partial [Campylobacter coli]